jgi:hypothetical protein
MTGHDILTGSTDYRLNHGIKYKKINFIGKVIIT